MKRHTAWELVEQYVIERFWPVGEPAENLRVLLNDYGLKDESDCRKAVEMLKGEFDPNKKKKEVNMNDLITLFQAK